MKSTLSRSSLSRAKNLRPLSFLSDHVWIFSLRRCSVKDLLRRYTGELLYRPLMSLMLAYCPSFKNSPQSQIEEVKDQYTGEIRLRYVNKARALAGGPQRIGHGHAKNKVPSEPTKKIQDYMYKLDKRLLEKLKGVRHGLSRICLTYTCRSLQTGPYGFDMGCLRSSTRRSSAC